MDIDLRVIATAEEAFSHLEFLEARARVTLENLEAMEPPGGFMERFLQTTLSAPESLLLVAESEAGAADLGLCLVGPHVDPLSGVAAPMILVLSVESKMRHRGLAGALVQEARRLLGRRGFTSLAARCAHGDDALISMGERWGFVREWEYLAKDGSTS